MAKQLIIWGAGGHGKVVRDVALSAAQFEDLVFFDDDPVKDGTTFCDCPVLAGLHHLDQLAGSAFMAAVGDNRIRARCYGQAINSGLTPAVLIHRSAVISPSAMIASGTVVMAGVVVNAGATISENCIINTGAVVEHDCIIDAHVHISPRVALGGGVSVGEFAHVGIGAIALPGARVGERSTVGAGAVVVKDAPADCTVVGIPAKVLRDARSNRTGVSIP